MTSSSSSLKLFTFTKLVGPVPKSSSSEEIEVGKNGLISHPRATKMDIAYVL